MSQQAYGNYNVQISGVAAGSTIQISYGGRTGMVPLQPAVVAVGKKVSSPARLVRARSGVVPYAARGGLLAELDAWTRAADPFGFPPAPSPSPIATKTLELVSTAPKFNWSTQKPFLRPQSCR